MCIRDGGHFIRGCRLFDIVNTVKSRRQCGVVIIHNDWMDTITKSKKSTCVYRTVNAESAGGLVHQTKYDPLTAPLMVDWLTANFPPAYVPNGEQRKRIRGKLRHWAHHTKNTHWHYTFDAGAMLAGVFPYFRHCTVAKIAKISADKFGALITK